MANYSTYGQRGPYSGWRTAFWPSSSGEALKRFRAYILEMDQATFAKRLGKSRSQISMYETCERPMNGRFYKLVSETFPDQIEEFRVQPPLWDEGWCTPLKETK